MGLKVPVENTQEAWVLKGQIDAQDLTVGVDYTWRYTPRVNTWLGDDTLVPASVEFEFTDVRWETYFQLKWTK
jgi:hypothetical protein